MTHADSSVSRHYIEDTLRTKDTRRRNEFHLRQIRVPIDTRS